MREIKFRAYIGDRNIMKDVVTYRKHCNGFSISYLDSLGNECPLMFSISHKIQLMQNTGIKDVNGVDIFEGDIMKDDINECFGEVKFVDGGFCVIWEDESSPLFEWTGEFIIGNIYENPELLEEI